jgi:heat shock protein HslJ
LASFASFGCDLESEPTSFGEREFQSESVEGYELAPSTIVRLRFRATPEFTANAGCNSIDGSYQLEAGRLVTGELAMTEIGCDGNLHEQDDWLLALLEGDPSYELDEPRLTLSDGTSTIVLLDEEVAVPDRPLVGTPWRVTGIVENDSVGAGAIDMGTLELADDGTLVFETPCAQGSGTFEHDESSLTLSGVTTTAPMCPSDEVSPMVDEHMREVLADGILEVEIDAKQLSLMRGSIGLTLTTD